MVTFLSVLGNLQRIPGCRLGEGLLLCKTLQREKLSTRFQSEFGITGFYTGPLESVVLGARLCVRMSTVKNVNGASGGARCMN